MDTLGPNEQIEVWFRAFGEDIYNFLLYYQGPDDVDDLVQETFLHALHSFHQFHGKASPKTWLMRIARNLAIDRSRKQRRTTIGIDAQWLNQLTATDGLPEATAEERESTQLYFELLQQVEAKYRDALILRCIHDYSFSQISELLGCTEGGARTRFHRGKKQAEAILNRFGEGGALA